MKDSKYAEAHNYLGFLLLQAGDYDDARYHLERAVTLRPAFTLARNNYADLFRIEGDTARARIEYQRVLEIEPDNAHATLQAAQPLVLSWAVVPCVILRAGFIKGQP